jgi:DNA-3-methyladenine glycosylase II
MFFCIVLFISHSYLHFMALKITKLTLSEGARELAKRDKDLARVINEIGLPGLRSQPPGFNAILKIICGQQISTSAAQAIYLRLAKIEYPMTYKGVLKIGPDRLKSAGLSTPKVKYVIGIATAIENGQFSFRRVARMEDGVAIKEMMKLKGIGRWSAEVYLLFALRRPDLWPVDDLGIIKAYTHLKGLKEYPDRTHLMKIGETWRPWRSVAARLLWHYINWVERKK